MSWGRKHTPEETAHRASAPRGRSRLARVLPIIGLAIGLAIVLYYPVSEAVDAWRRGQIAVEMDTQAAALDTSQKEGLLAQATAYNRALAGLTPDIATEDIWPYERQLSPEGHDTAFGYVLIPTLGLTMPVYHGTSDAVLSAGVGHIEYSSLPIGGETTHSVLSAHSGMEGMRAFDDIQQIEPGDVFAVKVLGDYYCYRVTGSEVVLPNELDSVTIQAGKDLCTLVTCTPYGVNSHRLLVHGERCEMPAGFLDERPSLQQVVTNRRNLPAIAGIAVAALLVVGLAARKVRRARRTDNTPTKGAPMR